MAHDREAKERVRRGGSQLQLRHVQRVHGDLVVVRRVAGRGEQAAVLADPKVRKAQRAAWRILAGRASARLQASRAWREVEQHKVHEPHGRRRIGIIDGHREALRARRRARPSQVRALVLAASPGVHRGDRHRPAVAEQAAGDRKVGH